MAFLVRKLIKRNKLDILNEVFEVDVMDADIPTTEFRTNNGTISTWHIDTLEKLHEAVLAIAVCSNKIDRMDFIIIDTYLLSENGLEFEQTYAGQEIAVPDLQDTHYDIINVSIKKLINCTKIYQSIMKKEKDVEKYIVRFTEGEIKDVFRKAIETERIDIDRVNGNLKKELSNLMVV